MKLKDFLLSAGIAAGAYALGHRTAVKQCTNLVKEELDNCLDAVKEEFVKPSDKDDVLELYFDTRDAAERFLSRADSLIKLENLLTLADVKSLMGASDRITFSDHLRGWRSVEDATITRSPNGYALFLWSMKDLRNIDN